VTLLFLINIVFLRMTLKMGDSHMISFLSQLLNKYFKNHSSSLSGESKSCSEKFVAIVESPTSDARLSVSCCKPLDSSLYETCPL